MKITASILYQLLPATFKSSKNKEEFSDNGLRAPLLYSGEFMYPDYVYIADKDEYTQGELQNCTIISIGEPDFDYDDIKADIIIVDESLTKEILFNKIQMIFHDLTYWNNDLMLISLKDMDINKMFTIGRLILPFSFVLLDKRFDPVTISPELGTDNVLSANNAAMLESLLADSKLSDTTEDNEVASFKNSTVRKNGMYFNIFYNSDYRAKLIAITDYSTEITDADMQLFRIFARHFEVLYERYAISPMRSESYESLQEILRDLINGNKSFPPQTIKSALDGANWKESDVYVAYYIPYEEDVNISIKSAYILTLLENKWNKVITGSTRGLALNNCIVWIVNASMPADVTPETFIPQFEEFLSQFNAKAGASNMFSNFLDLGTYVRQARLAYEFGKTRHPEKIFYSFSDYSLDYLLEHCTDSFSTNDVVTPAILKLIAYDRRENTEFCKTLRLFFYNKYNATQTSDALYIHRSTFAARIKRIEEICGIDLGDERTRLHILMSFYLLENEGTLAPFHE